jgi:hypothetical protein
MRDEAFSAVVIPTECAGVRDDGFAGDSYLRWRNCSVGGERLAYWEVWVRGGSQSEHQALFLHGKLAELAT